MILESGRKKGGSGRPRREPGQSTEKDIRNRSLWAISTPPPIVILHG
uniref:Uncharacterized protein n=1 Tax=Nomascus leucogenys TaxID=61853 RepID=A0A2I3GBT8_NOMLE